MADADLLLIVLAALQDPECGVRTFKKSRPLKRARNCFLGSQLIETLKLMGVDDARKGVEIGMRLLDAGLVSPWEGRATAWSDACTYAFSDYVVMDRAYIADELPAALTFFCTTPYEPRPAPGKSEPLYGPLIAKRRPFGIPASPSSSSAPMAAPVDSSRFLEEDSDEISFMLSGDDPVPVVKAGTIERLVERLTYDKFIDLRFQDRFLMAYRTCLSASGLLRMLVERYTMRPPLEMLSEAAEKEWLNKKKLVQLRTLTVLSRWIVTQFECDWASDPMKLTLFTFIDDHVAGYYDTLALQIRNNYHKGYEAMLQNHARYEPPSLPELRAAAPLTLDEANLEATAMQLTLHESHLFSAISLNELLSFGWSKRAPEQRDASRNVLRVIHFFNTISAWVVADIVTRLQLRQRVQQLQRYIHLALKLRELNNFNGAMAVGAALLSSPIQRLTQTWAELPEQWQRVAAELQALFSYSHSYRTYRTALRSASMPCLPYLGLFLTDLTFIEESQPDRLENGLINFAKMAHFARVCSDIQRYQRVPYRFPPNRPLLASILLVKVPLSGEDEAYEMSLKIEPRNQKESFEQLLLNEEKLRAELRQYVVRTADLEAENARLRGELAAFDEQLRHVLRHSGREAMSPSVRLSLANHVRTRLHSQRLPASPLAGGGLSLDPLLPEPDLPSSSSMIFGQSRLSDSTRPSSFSDQLLLGLRMPGSGSTDGGGALVPKLPRDLPLNVVSYSSPSSASPSPPSPLTTPSASPPSSPSSVSAASSTSGVPSAAPPPPLRTRPYAALTDAGPRPMQPPRTASINISRPGSAEGQVATRKAPAVSVEDVITPSSVPGGGVPVRKAWWEKEREKEKEQEKKPRTPPRQQPTPPPPQQHEALPPGGPLMAWWEVLQKPDTSPPVASPPPLSLSSPSPSTAPISKGTAGFKSTPAISPQRWYSIGRKTGEP